MIGLSQKIEAQQKQTLSRRLQLAVRLLQMSSLDFTATVQDLLGRNPFLEAAEGADEAEPAAAHTASDAGTGAAEPDNDNDREMWATGGERSGLRRAEDNEISALELTPVRVGLREHLRLQLNVLRLSERDRVLASIIAESVDDDGYLRQPLNELGALGGLIPAPAAEELSIALRRVQALEPMGVAARDVAECLRLQLPRIGCERSRALARRIVDEHLQLLAGRHLVRLARELDATAAEVEAACEALRQLDPRPGARFDASHADYIVPDVIAYRSRGQWQVKLNPVVVPRVRMNMVYAELFRRHRKSSEHGALDEHLSEARWAMRNIEQRFATILDVAGAIVRRQRHFLDFGPMAMKPLALKEIADEIGVHESTVSRVTNNKFIATPSGVHELKYFFSRGLAGGDGAGACSGTAIRGLIKAMIDAERPGSPLTDVDIAQRLERQGLSIARRTVTKYRQMMKIESGGRRRRPGEGEAAAPDSQPLAA